MSSPILHTIVMLLLAGSALALEPPVAEVHRCTNNPFTRSVGLLGGRQPELFLRGPDMRPGKPPRVDARTRVVDLGWRRGLSEPTAAPVIDKCASWWEWSERDGMVKLTVLWDEPRCTPSVTREERRRCRARQTFGFSLAELDIGERPDTDEEREALAKRLERELVADVYFAEQVRPRARRGDTGTWAPARRRLHLVARVIRKTPAADDRARER
jgi:hypothetical protein